MAHTSLAVSPHLPPHRRRSVVASSSGIGDTLAAAGRLLWGRGLPPAPLVVAVRSTWSATWHLFMRQLAPADPASGSYRRPPSRFPSVPARYLQNPNPSLHLYVGLPCPWAHRVLIVRALKNLEDRIPLSVAAPGVDGSWQFTTSGVGGSGLDAGPDLAHGRRTLREVYELRPGGYDGRATVPLLWDVEMKEAVCNESYIIAEFLNLGFPGATDSGPDLCPPKLKEEVDRWNLLIYPAVNNGVYRCGFAQTQQAYDAAVNELFAMLDKLESHLSSHRYLCGDTLTLADVCLFTTLIRFDLVYNILFKCTKRKLTEYTSLHAYTSDIYRIPKVAETCNLGAIMDGYYGTLFPLNPGGIRPIMPSGYEGKFLKPQPRKDVEMLTSVQ